MTLLFVLFVAIPLRKRGKQRVVLLPYDYVISNEKVRRGEICLTTAQIAKYQLTSVRDNSCSFLVKSLSSSLTLVYYSKDRSHFRPETK